LSGVDLGQAVVAVLAVLAMADEYGSGLIRVSLAARPRRLVLLTAKAVNLAGLTAAAGVVAVAGSLAGSLLAGRAHALSVAAGHAAGAGAGPSVRAAAGSVVYLVLVALLALGLATAVRDTAVSIGAVLALLYLPPLLAQALHGAVRRHVEQVAPMTAGLAVQATTHLGARPIGPWAGLGVLAGWAAAALAAGGLLLHLRDA
ncbi:MAG TPA: hypothetical protein VKV06_00040, partial [Acidimicrobiales bacterium]|nr:hypothetical protein [Acidimicrobiales bacterium]